MCYVCRPVVGIAERLYNIYICRHTQNAARRGKRGQARQGADLGADPGADFIFEMRGIVGRLIELYRANVKGVYARSCYIAGPGINPRHVDALLVKNYRAVLL